MKTFIFLLPFFFLQFSFANDAINVNEQTGKIEINEGDLSPELFKELEKFQKENEAFLKNFEQHKNDPTFLLKKAFVNEEGEKSFFGKGQLDEVIKKALFPFRIMSEEQVKTFLLSNSKGNYLHPFLSDNPRVLTFLAKLLKDNKAIPGLSKVLNNKDKFWAFILTNIFLIIMMWLIKKIQKSESFFQDFKNFLFRFFLANTLRIALVILFFHQELTPAYKIFKKVFL